ncbi:hypothetical protein [Pseudomonas wadenswilerensis]|uniref:hypothetical protein n=1 Tax=Pseudomonas wadenswilerensis TaxID=1785161 RepID=UPI00215ED4F4|nr:hypothetical protein [Pseudomonas wadenswilerensis]UVM20215.1 hypothetical protein LOY45_17350 [Pseudomonas wadenswilerensis]
MLEHFKYIAPLATFALGIWATPLIENRKEKAKAKAIFNNLSLELDDELIELEAKLKKMAAALISLKKLKNGEPEIGQPFYYVPRDTICQFLKPATETSFRRFNKSQRFAIKSLSVQVEAINGYRSQIKNTQATHETFDEVIKIYKRYLHTGSCMLNTMRIISGKPQANLSGDDNAIINTVLSELKIELNASDLIITSTLQIENPSKNLTTQAIR